MSPPVPSLASPGVQAYTDGQLYWIIGRGLWPSGRPAARGILTEEEMWSIVLYIRHLPPVGSLGDPRGTVAKSAFLLKNEDLQRRHLITSHIEPAVRQKPIYRKQCKWRAGKRELGNAT
jgi:hypothetical protein